MRTVMSNSVSDRSRFGSSGTKPVVTANQENCRTLPPGNTEPRDIRASGAITRELMEKHVKDGQNVGVEDLHRWPSDSKALRFLSETTTASLVDELRKVS